MIWDDFYDRYCDWSESTVKTRISSLEDIGKGEEVVEVVVTLSDEKIKAQLIRKAMKLGVSFTHDDFMELDGELPDDLYAEVAQYGAFYLGNPYFDEYDFDWDDFCAECDNLPEDMILRCIPRIKKFGDSDEVVGVILSVSYPADDALYERAVACGVKFTKAQKEVMGREDLFFVKEIEEFNKLTDEDIKKFAENVHTVEKRVDADIKRIQEYNKQQTSNSKATTFEVVKRWFKSLFGGK